MGRLTEMVYGPNGRQPRRFSPEAIEERRLAALTQGAAAKPTTPILTAPLVGYTTKRGKCRPKRRRRPTLQNQ